MDSGLGVRWPLSPFATALAAGALFAFCVALWKHRTGIKKGTGKDPSGRKFGKDLDPKKEKDVCEKPSKEKNEAEAESNRNFPVLTLGDFRRGFNYEHLLLSGQFGAIPRIPRRNQSLENPNLYSAFRRRNVKRENKNWHEFNPTSSNFSCIYQQPFCFGSELPRLNARFLLNFSPHLHSYFNQFRDNHIPGNSRKTDFDNFDVSIKPEILQNKPITRSAVCLALERQLHKFLEEPFHEIKVNERAIQTVDISEENEDGASGNNSSNDRDLNLHSDSDANIGLKPDSDEYDKKFNTDLSLWDSGYGEKAFDDRCSSPKDHSSDENVLMGECSNVFNAKREVGSENLNFTQHFESTKESIENLLTNDNKIQNASNCDKFLELSEEHVDELNIQTNVTDFDCSDIQDLDEESKTITFGDNRNIFQNKCLDQKLEKYSEEIHVSFSDQNVLTDIGNLSNIYLDSDRESEYSTPITTFPSSETQQSLENLTFRSSDLELIQNTFPSCVSQERQKEFKDENLFRGLENMSVKEKNLDLTTRASGVDAGVGAEEEDLRKKKSMAMNSDLERIQNKFDNCEEQNKAALSPVPLETKLSEERNSRVTKTATPARDVTEGGASRDSAVFDEKGTFNVPRQMDRETGERSVAVESTVTTETTFRANGDARLSTAVVSRLSLDDWTTGAFDREDSVSVRTTVNEEVFRPTFEEFVPLKSSDRITKNEVESLEELLPFGARNGNDKKELDEIELPTSPRVDRLKGLLNRDEERRARTKFHHLADGSHVGGAMEGEWDRLLRGVLASVSELERWERRHCDVSSDAEDAEQQHPFSQSDSSFAMEEETLSPKGETPTKVKSLRFKLDPDVFDVPSDDSFYDDDDDETRRFWKKQSKYRAFSSLELNDEPVRLVSVHASVVPAGQKMVARPVGIDLRVRLTEERQSKRAHVSTSPSQAKRRSPVSDRGIGWCQELSPVTENVDWRETFTPVTPECKSVPNGILKTPSPKTEPSPVESPNPFKLENGVTTNGVSPVIEKKRLEKSKYNGLSWKAMERKPFLMPRKKFEPDPEAIERITGYKSALSKPPLPPPVSHKVNSSLTVRNRAEQARKQYLDSKAALCNSRIDGTKKFQQFLSQAQNDRARIVTSVPDLAAIERAVTEQWTKERASVSPRESPGREDNLKIEGVPLSRGNTPDDKWASYVQSCRQHLGRRSQSMSYLETDIDIIPVLDEDDKCHSTSALDEPDEALPDPDDSDLDRSREDLDDSGRAKSEHELRIERSLRSLPIPEWYRRSEKTKTGFLLGSSNNKEKRGWAAAKSLASSTSSLASCGLRRPVRSLRSSRENIPWSRSSASPDGPTLSLALAKAFREPYLGWRARTPTSSGVSSSPRASPPSWGATTTDDEANGVSFDGEDAFGRTTSSEEDRRDEPLSLDDTGADAVTVSMDTNDPVKLPGGEDTCDDINNMSMDTCELFDASVVVPVDEDPSPQADTGDDIDNLSTDTTTTEGRKLDPKLKRYSYSQSIYHSEWDEEEESRGDRKGKEEDREPSPSSPDHKVVWIESSFVGSRTTTSIMVLPEKKAPGSTQERPASR